MELVLPMYNGHPYFFLLILWEEKCALYMAKYSNYLETLNKENSSKICICAHFHGERR